MEISEEEYKEFLRLKNLKWALDLLQTEQGKKEYASEVLQVENEDLKANITQLKDLYCLIANCAIQIREAQDDGLPGKAASFVEELLNHLILHAPEGDFNDTQVKLRQQTWAYINNSLRNKNEQ